MPENEYVLYPLGFLQSPLKEPGEAPRQGREGAPDAWLEVVPVAGVFATRSPDRPNPLGLHRVTVREIAGERLKVGPIEAIDGTPVVDIKPVLPQSPDA